MRQHIDRFLTNAATVQYISLILALDVSVLAGGLVWLAYTGATTATLSVLAGALATLVGVVWAGLRAKPEAKSGE